jgi:predicted RNA-binding Zn-ribbon protein involved in translation (DUF1610 family)
MKRDGYRALAIADGPRVQLVSRSEKTTRRENPRSSRQLPPSAPSAWRCPACATQIPLRASEERPRADVSYRCPVCRLELTYDEKRNTLDVPPLDSETNDTLPKPRR